MNKAFISILTDYLKNEETDYALMIHGTWGSGKTFFIKNTIKNKIEQIECPDQKGNDKKKTYKQIFVSLYGVSSIEEVKERIFYAINPNCKWIEITANKLLSFASIIPHIGDAIKNTSPNDKEKAELRDWVTNYDDKVIVFDDLERIDTNKIDTQSILGYINSLTEHNHYKVVVVANDEILGKDYKKFKEKTIRFSYHHIPQISDIFNSICEKYNTNKNYKTFLNTQKQFILNIISAGRCDNLRTIIFITDVYLKVFEHITGEFSDEINKDLLLPFVIISIEAKNGHTKNELKDELPLINSLRSTKLFSNNEQNSKEQITPKEKYNQELNTKYRRFKSNRTIPFYSILFDLVYDGYATQEDLESMITELRNEHISKIETDEIKLAKQIINWTQIPDNDFSDVVNIVKNNVKKNKYCVSDLLRIYAAFLQIEAMNIDGFTLSDNDVKTIKKAIDNSMKNQQYDKFFDVNLPIWDYFDKSDMATKYNELRQYALNINAQHEEILKLNKKQSILSMISENKIEQFKSFFVEYNNKVLFVEIPPKDLTDTITVANAEIKKILLEGLIAFFPEHLTNPTKADLDYLEELSNILNKYLNTQTVRKPSLANLFLVQDYLNKVILQYKTI